MANDTISKMYVTSDFVNDAQRACNTLYLFGAAFNWPFNGPAGSAETDVTWQRECIKCYTSCWINYANVNQWSHISLRLNCTDRSSAEVRWGYGVPTCIDYESRQLIVKIPYLSMLNYQWMGYLTYTKDLSTLESSTCQDKVAFYFVIRDYINVDGRNNQNDVSYLCFDLSAMNLAASIQPIYNCVTKSLDGTVATGGGGYVCSHYHNLSQYTISDVGCSYVSGCDPNYVDVGSVAQCVRENIRNYTSITSALNNGTNDGVLMASDGRYVSSDAATHYASDYETSCSCAKIATSDTCLYPERCILDPTTGCCYEQYECNTSGARLFIQTANSIHYDDIIYFAD